MTRETVLVTVTESPQNAWRQETPGPAGWAHSARPDDPNKYFMVSSDCHANEPASYLSDHIEAEFRERLPHIEVRADGSQYSVSEGNRPMMIRPADAVMAQASGERQHFSQRLEPEDALRNATGRTIDQRLADQAADGVDVELVFPNKGLLCWATPDPVFAMSMCARGTDGPTSSTAAHSGWSNGRTRPLGAASRRATSTARMRGDRVGGRARLPSACASATPPIYGPTVGASSSTTTPSFEAHVVACSRRRGFR